MVNHITQELRDVGNNQQPNYFIYHPFISQHSRDMITWLLGSNLFSVQTNRYRLCEKCSQTKVTYNGCFCESK